MKVVEKQDYIPTGRPRYPFYDDLAQSIRSLPFGKAVEVAYAEIPSFKEGDTDTYRMSVVVRQALGRRGLPVAIVREDSAMQISRK